MSESLFLNKIRVDIGKKPITRKIQIAKISEVTERKSSSSYTVTLPGTSRNKVFFDMLGTIGNTSRKPFEEVVADYFIDGIQIITEGYAIIRKKGKGYSVNLIDGIRSLSNLLSGKKLIDLPLSDLDHILTTLNYTDSYENTEGYIYCIGDYGFGVSANLKVEQQAPSIYVHTLFRRIFESNGLSLLGDFFTENVHFLTEVLTPAKGYLIEDVVLTETPKGSADTDVLVHQEISPNPLHNNQDFTFSDIDLVDISIVDGNLVFANAGVYKIDIDTDYEISDGLLTQITELNGSGKSYNDLPGESGILSISVVMNIAASDVVSLRINSKGTYDSEISRYLIDYVASSEVSVTLQEGGQLIEVSDYIGEINQIDFIKDIINRYGLILKPLLNSGEFEFKQLKTILQDTENAEDWTKKFAGITNENYISGYAQINKAKYAYDEAIVIPNNDGEMLIDNVNAENEKEMFSSAFEIPVVTTVLGGENTYKILIWEFEDPDITNIETPLKVMKILRVDTPINAKLFTEVTGISIGTDIPFLSLNNMSMQFFLNSYYAELKSMIEDYREVSGEFNLSVLDIYNLNFFKLKYLKQTGKFYYLNTVQHTAGKVSIIKITEVN